MKSQNKFRRIPKIIHSKIQLIFLGVICLFGIIFIYYLLMMLRVGIGMSLNLLTSYDKYIFFPTQQDTSFYNFITAIFAFIFGLSIFLKNLFIPIKQFKSKSFSFKKNNIISDVSILFTGFYMIAIKSIFFVFLIFDGFFPKNLEFGITKSIWVLFAIVMYLELWKTILLIFGRKAIYKMLLLALIIIPFAFGLSKIDVYNFDKIYEVHKKNQVEYKYQIEYPKSIYYNDSFNLRRKLQLPITIGYNIKINNKNRYPDIIYKGTEFKLKDISKIIKEKQQQVSRNELPRIFVNIDSDKNVKMKYINQLKDSISYNGINNITFRVIPNTTIDFLNLNREYYIPEINFKRNKNTSKPPKPINLLNNRILKLKLFDNDSVQFSSNINNFSIKELKTFILKDPKNYIFKLYFDKSSTLENYINIKAIILSVIISFRNDYCMEHFDLTYDELLLKGRYNPRSELYRGKIRKVKGKFPIMVSLND